MEDRVATEPNQIAKMLREVVEIMEDRYKTHFNSISSFGKDYTDFGLPPFIVIFDEFSAFLHSVDKKLSKEVLDYIFTIVMKGREKSGGYIQIDGIHTDPVYFETPYIDKDFDFIQEITKLVKYKKQVIFYIV